MLLIDTAATVPRARALPDAVATGAGAKVFVRGGRLMLRILTPRQNQ